MGVLWNQMELTRGSWFFGATQAGIVGAEPDDYHTIPNRRRPSASASASAPPSWASITFFENENLDSDFDFNRWAVDSTYKSI